MESNNQTYNRSSVVEHYAGLTKLQAAEKVIVKELNEVIQQANVLDIGIGGGRTTYELAPLAKSYIGLDYAQSMVEYCKEAFSDIKHAEFVHADARKLPDYFSENQFDVVMFSFNGIDCVPFEDRQQILDGVNYILKSEGHFIFSIHNIRNLDKLYSFQFPRNPLKYPKELRRKKLVKKYNGDKEQYRQQDWCILKDGADDFTTDVLYMKPELQVAKLKEMGFESVRLFEIKHGNEIQLTDLANYTMPWVYFLCKKK